MAYHIAVDSCTDMTAAMKKDEHITLVHLTLNVGEDKFIDDETFNQAEFLRHVAECPEAPSSACPSPDAYMQAYGYDNEDAYAVTLSAELSGSYNSAKLGADLLKEEYPEKNMFECRQGFQGSCQRSGAVYRGTDNIIRSGIIGDIEKEWPLIRS